MRDCFAVLGFAAALAVCAPSAGRADVVLETRQLRLSLADNATVTGLRAVGSKRELLAKGPPQPAFRIRVGGKTSAATAVKLRGDQLRVDFGAAAVVATLQVVRSPQYVALSLVSLTGKPIEWIELLRLPMRPMPKLGRWINIAYDKDFGVCLCAGNLVTKVSMSNSAAGVLLSASAHREVALKGTTAVLIGCADPAKRFLDAMAVVERDFKMPPGATARKSPAQKHSYLWVAPTVADVGEYVQWAKRGGFRTILYSYTALTKSAGHFQWNSKYPGGLADLKKVADTIRRAGLSVGFHMHYNKAHLRDPYVTPVPDARLHQTRAFTLRDKLGVGETTIGVRENPRGCPKAKGRGILRIGRELIGYEKYTTRGQYQFQRCRRGHLGTTPAGHRSRAKVALLDVDTWPVFIRFDQNTDIQDEVAARLARIVNETGPYEMIYFDGAEDVHSPFWYHCASAQYRVFRHFRVAPVAAEAAANTHFGWHMISRSNAYDSVAPAKMKAFCRTHPCRGAALRARDFSRINFGWLQGFWRSETSWIGPDVLEYITSRAAGWDCPISLTVRLTGLKSHPRAGDCFDMLKLWEDARIGGRIGEGHRRMLRQLDREHHLFLNERGKEELVTIQEVPTAAGGRLVKAYRFRRVLQPLDTIVLIWALVPQAELVLPKPPKGLKVMRPFGKELPVAMRGGAVHLPVGDRQYLVFPDTSPRAAAAILSKATATAKPALSR